MKPKLIFTDLDGTLLDDDKRVSAANRAALERAAAQGAQVVVSTGRFPWGIPQDVEELPFLRYFIYINGGLICDRETGAVLRRADIDLETVWQVLDFLEPLDLSVDCCVGDRLLMDRRHYDNLEHFLPEENFRQSVLRTRAPQEDLRAALRAENAPVQKIQCFFAQVEQRPAVVARTRQKFPQLAVTDGLGNNMALNAGEATKGNAIRFLCRLLRVDLRDTLAFGDSTNDLDMLRLAGVGVAMANARQEAKDAAGTVTGTNLEDGVAQTLAEYFPE